VKKLSVQRGIVHLLPLLIVLAVVIAGLVLLWTQRQPKEERVQIIPSQLMPEVTASEARTTICDLKKDGLFVEVCQEKFNNVGKSDGQKIVELFGFLDKIKNDQTLSNYDRVLLVQAVFAALPNKDSSEAYLYQPALLSGLFIRPGIASAQGQIMTEEEFKEMMYSDLKTMVDSLPKGDNTWTIMVMVSKYTWVDGERQPTYSQTFSEHFEDFPGNPNPPDSRDITYHTQARVGNRMTGQTADIGQPTYKGTSEMLAYSFTIVSWEMPEYTHPDGSTVDYEYTPVHRNYSENLYQGEHYINELLADVKMPPPPTRKAKSAGESRQDKDESKIDKQLWQDCSKKLDESNKCVSIYDECKNICDEKGRSAGSGFYEVFWECMESSDCEEKSRACTDQAQANYEACLNANKTSVGERTESITCEKLKKLFTGGGDCQYHGIIVEGDVYNIWCTSSVEAPIGNESRPPDYTTTDSEWVKCGSESLKQ